MAEGGSSTIEDTCGKLEEAMKKMAEQDIGEEDSKPFLDNIEWNRTKDSTVEDMVNELFSTDKYNEDWNTAYSSEEEKDGDEIKARTAVAYFSAWKKAILKFYGRNSDVEQVFGGGVEFRNTAAQSIEAVRVVLAENAQEEPGE